MKRIFILFGLSLLIASCSVKYKSADSKVAVRFKTSYPELTNNFEKFDTSVFHVKTYTKINNGDTLYRSYDTQTFFEMNNGKEIIYFSRGNNDDSISGYDYSFNPLIGIHKEYYPGGNIKLKGIYCWFGFNIGIWFQYDTNGKLIDSVDYDHNYPFGAERVLAFCIANNIPLEKAATGPRTIIRRTKNINGDFVWSIEYQQTGTGQYISLSLDAKNGKVLRTGTRMIPIPDGKY
jgi:uncharacterized membrane protein YkoI